MLEGDLASGPLEQVLRRLGADGATGCLHLAGPAGGTARVYLHGGQAYAVHGPGEPAALGPRLVSSGALAPEALAQAVEAQRTGLSAWHLDELLVHLGHVEQGAVEAFRHEQQRATLLPLLDWDSGRWSFRHDERTRDQVAPPVAVDALLAQASGPHPGSGPPPEAAVDVDAVPVLSTAGCSDSEVEIPADAWALLCKVDGVRTLGELAHDCGFPLPQAGAIVHLLVEAGLLEVEGEEWDAADEPYEVLAPGAMASRLAAALTGSDASPASGSRRIDLTEAGPGRSLAAVSAFAPPTASDDLFAAPLRRAQQSASAQEHVAQVVDLGSVREAQAAASAAAAAEAAELAESERVAAEQEAARVEAELVEAEREAAELAESERVAAEQEAAERTESERVAAEQAVAAAAAELASFVEEAGEPDEDQPAFATGTDAPSAEESAAAFAELTASAQLEVLEPVTAPVEPDPDEPADEPARSYGHDTDTASLLRELSSLGLDDDPPPPVRPARPPAPRPVPVAAKKRKGLFGRG